MGHFSLLLLPLLFFAGPLNAWSKLAKAEDSPVEPKNTAPLSCKKMSTHFQVRGDLLYWLPEASGLEINFGSGSSLESTVDGVTTTISKETDVEPSFHWNVGYRVALGAQFDHNRWEVGGLWTDFEGLGRKAIDNGEWRVKLKQLDIAALYSVCLTPSVALHPFVGLRGTSIFQKLFSQVITDVVISGSGTATDTRTFQDHQQFYGLGPLFGLNGDCDIEYGLGLYGTVAFSLLYGTYHLHFDDTEVVTAPATPSQIYSTIKKDTKAFDFDVDLALGIQWQYLVRNTCYLTMKFGVENHQYFDQSRLGKNFGNLSFSGGTFSLSLAY